MYDLLIKLFPICRSLTGRGNRETLRIISTVVKELEVREYPSGDEVFDWIIPDEWSINDAYLMDEDGVKVIDFKENNLHVLQYSQAVDTEMNLEDLQSHLYSLSEKPELIPYVTSYYERRWGFCLAQKQRDMLKSNMSYKVKIDSALKPGSLSIGEAFLKGESDQEILISSYICHPSMANDSLSGVVLAAYIYKYLADKNRLRYSYRFLFVPETIGAIAYLFNHGDLLKEKLYAGLVCTCVGDDGDFNYKRTKQGDHELDRLAENVLEYSGYKYHIRDFWPLGSDERQYSSPGFDLPVASLMRSVYGEFPEYHTSGDNLDLVSRENMENSFEMYRVLIDALESNKKYLRTQPYCEPMLGKYGLYDSLGAGCVSAEDSKRIMMWVLNYSDGQHDLLDCAEYMRIPIGKIIKVAHLLEDKGLIYSEDA